MYSSVNLMLISVTFLLGTLSPSYCFAGVSHSSRHLFAINILQVLDFAYHLPFCHLPIWLYGCLHFTETQNLMSHIFPLLLYAFVEVYQVLKKHAGENLK